MAGVILNTTVPRRSTISSATWSTEKPLTPVPLISCMMSPAWSRPVHWPSGKLYQVFCSVAHASPGYYLPAPL